MLKNYFKIAVRNILKNKGYSITCIAGLALGMLVAFVVLFLIMHETSYDKYQPGADKTFIYYAHAPKINIKSAYTPIVLANTLKDQFPEIKNIAQVRDAGEIILADGNNNFKIENFYYADADIFQILSFNFISGKGNSFYEKPNAAVISRKVYDNYFSGSKDVVGNVVKLKYYGDEYLVEISGIYENVPENSQFRPDIILNNQFYKNSNSDILMNWGYRNFITYIHLKDNVDEKAFFKKTGALLDASYAKVYNGAVKIDNYFMPLTDVHLYSTDIGGIFGKKGSINKIYVYLAIGLLTLLIACSNFINISTAKSSIRAKEIGVRKVVGASKRGIVFQFLTESVLVSFLSLPLTIMLFELLKPFIAEYFDRSFIVNYFHNWQFLTLFAAIVLFIGVFSGLNSALMASKHSPIEIFKSQNLIKSSKSVFRRVLLTFQFVIFIGMFVCSYVIYDQMQFLNNAEPGYDKENLIAVLFPYGNKNNSEAFINEVKQNPDIINASLTSSIPPTLGNRVTGRMKSIMNPDQELVEYQVIECDSGYKDVLGLEIKEGRFFDAATSWEVEPIQAVINETAEKDLGINNPVGKIIDFNGKKIQIIGVIKDFNFNSFYDLITPMILLPTKNMLAGAVIKANGNNTSSVISKIEQQWNKFFPNIPFSYKFVDEELNKIYKKDQLFGTLIICFTIISTLIAVIGLAGLVAFTTSQRVKEIGIRKVLGSSVYEILYLLLKEIFLILLIGCVISFPIAHYFISDWLTTFAYRTEITYGVFFVAFIASLLIAMLAVGFQTIRAATANPIESLRYE